MITISVFQTIPAVRLPKKKLRDTAVNVLVGEGIHHATINIIVVSDDEIHSMNNEYLQHDYATDVLSFSLGESDEIDGEVYISLDTAKTQAIAYNVSITNELQRLTAHGVLHLVGYDDESAEQREIMKKLEDRYISFSGSGYVRKNS